MDFSNGKRIAVDVLTESTTTYRIEPGAAQRAHNPETCSETGGRATILGFETFRVQRDLATTQAGKVFRRESWVAPALGCFALRWVDTETHGGALVSRTVGEAVSVLTGAPDAALFRAPEGFTERPPSGVFREAARRENKACTVCEKGGAAHQDAAYFSRQ
jgi:hypothetical protein